MLLPVTRTGDRLFIQAVNRRGEAFRLISNDFTPHREYAGNEQGNGAEDAPLNHFDPHRLLHKLLNYKILEVHLCGGARRVPGRDPAGKNARRL